VEIGWTLAGERLIPQSPNLVWPADHAWCLTSETDLVCSLLAGSNELAEDLRTATLVANGNDHVAEISELRFAREGRAGNNDRSVRYRRLCEPVNASAELEHRAK
jgi:hypothetical protein